MFFPRLVSNLIISVPCHCLFSYSLFIQSLHFSDMGYLLLFYLPSNKKVSTSFLISRGVRPFPFSSCAVSRISRKSRYFRLCNPSIPPSFSYTKCEVSISGVMILLFEIVIVVVLVFYGPSTLFKSFRARSVNQSTLFEGNPPRQFTST